MCTPSVKGEVGLLPMIDSDCYCSIDHPFLQDQLPTVQLLLSVAKAVLTCDSYDEA